METLFTSDGPGSVKRWSRKTLYEISTQSYWLGHMAGTEDAMLPVCVKSDLEQGPGDEITFYLAAKITGRPVQGKEKGEGRQKALDEYTDKLRINVNRMPVEIGDIMDQKRRPYDLRMSAVRRLSDYWAEYLDEEMFAQLSGQRGTGENIQHLPVGYTGFPHAFTPPDSDHVMYPGAVTSKATMTGADLMSREMIEQAVLRGKNFKGGKSKRFTMNPVQVEGGKYHVCAMHNAQMFDLRQEVGDAGWLTLEKARATAIGSKSPIFMGAAGATALLNGTILHEHSSLTYSNDYGAGNNVMGVRALFMGAHAGMLGWGTKAKTKNGVRMDFKPSETDLGFRKVLDSITVCALKRTQYDGSDFACISIDTSVSAKAKKELLDATV